MTSNTNIHSQSLMIPSDTAGINLHVRNKRPQGMERSDAAHTIVMMHGATYSSTSLYDTRIEGYSFLDYLAAAGFNVYAVDVRGYGESTRPLEMGQPAADNPPLVRTETAIRDFGTAVEYAIRANDVEQVNIIGMSWGGTVTGAYTVRNASKVRKLGLIAPQWLSDLPIPLDAGGQLHAHRVVNASAARTRWIGAAPEEKRETLIPDGGFEAWLENTVASEPDKTLRAEQSFVASNGPIADVREYWSAGKPLYEPAEIEVPLLLVLGEWDIDVPPEAGMKYFKRAVKAPFKRLVTLSEATHMLVLEKNREQAFRELSVFIAAEVDR
ncbi:alpha/beta hydrolase [Pseudomonas sp. LP_7_YM]|uniref:alpha/beta hydrolase n=1 Tax=Pseudomonas sp. LP_7_YM TaxID=2485137 RepID=UPI00105C7B4C|nr:alpha/beta hydrolase [Pseudomonas sp. LP_7_YM]TDV72651.1 pimeloyl-ACP methyl ester carboxylesterase [Pseudomonas sp. LP_7_YM]